MAPRIGLIAAIAKGNVIGKDGDMPWHLPADLKRFKRVTSGHAVLMGRKTFEAIGRPLPNRRNIVISRQADFAPKGFAPQGIETAGSLEAALNLVAAEEQVFVIGGGEIYRQALPLADFLDLCEIDLQVDGDAFFPDFDRTAFVEESRETFPPEEETPGYSFVRYRRAGARK